MILSRRKIILAGLLGSGAFALQACISPPSVTRNIRVTAQAEVAGKIVEGSAVMSLRWKAGDGSRMYHQTRSEAIVLDLDGRGTVYILDAWQARDGQRSTGLWFNVVHHLTGVSGNGRVSDFPKIEAIQGRIQLEKAYGGIRVIPTMAYLTDETKYETLTEVTQEEFPVLFGDDVRFLGFWIEFTEDEETSIIPERLPVALLTPRSKSFMEKSSNYGRDGKLLSWKELAFPQSITPIFFFHRGF